MPGIASLTPGDPPTIGGYRLLGRLGAGGQGVVYQGHSPQQGMVAVKALHAEWLLDSGARSRLAKEVAAARRVAPFCTARVLEAELDGEQPYVVSEFIPGLTLNDQVRQAGPLTGTSLDRLAVGTMTALVAIHEAQLVHRDLKPSNVVLGPDGPRVVDFGIARDLSGQGTHTDAIVGTPAFMAPEQISAGLVGPSADLFSWATTMVFAATGRSPFNGGHVAAVLYRVTTEEVDLTGVPGSLAGVLQACLVKDPAGRPTAQQVLMVLLGQPMPAQDVEDPTDLLNHAVRAVGAVAAPGSDPGQPASPPFTPPPFTSPGSTPPELAPPLAHVPVQPVTELATPPSPTSPLPPAQTSQPSPLTQPQTSPLTSPQPAGGAAARPRPSRWSVLLAAAGGLALVAGAGLALVAWREGSTQAPIVVASGPTVPAQFAGSWIGSLTRGSDPAPVRIDLRQGSTVGQLADADCQAVMVVTAVNDDSSELTLTSAVSVDPGQNCVKHAEITLTVPAQPSPATGGGQAPSLDVRSTDLEDTSTDPANGTVTRTG